MRSRFAAIVNVLRRLRYTQKFILIGLLFLGDEVRSGFALVATAGFLIAVSGAIALARFTDPLPSATQPAAADVAGT